MAVLKIILTVLFILVCVALAAIILLQEGKASGLGAISGAADTYWGKNKGRSMEGKLEKGTKLLVVAFFVIAVLLNIPSITDTDSKNASTTNNNTNTTVQDSSAGGASTSDDDEDSSENAEDNGADASSDAVE